jgi:2-polyprenyl-3-methyl-5-hydroxy-6-metoxy-1,4-benzoquinol methylase
VVRVHGGPPLKVERERSALHKLNALAGRVLRIEVGSAESDYQLGADPVELDRLNRQGRVLAPATRTILEAAGVRNGMRVLDLGSGMGDMAFSAAELVGPTGVVVGIDRSPEPVAKANLRARQQGLAHLRFLVGDIHDPAPYGPYDVIVGRLVLMYVPDPAAVIRTQARQLRPGGLVVPIEFDLYSARSIPATPLVAQALSWLSETFKRAAIDPALGPRLWTIQQEAGLQPKGMIGVQPHFGPEDPEGPAILAGIVRTVVPLMERSGVASAAEVGTDTLQQRLGDELRTYGSVFAHPMLISAWATADGASLT